jgi:hypothetical protein
MVGSRFEHIFNAVFQEVLMFPSSLLKKIEQEALSLSRQERAFLADRLLSSLDGDTLTEVDTV